MIDASAPFVAYSAPARLYAMAALCAGFVALCLWLALTQADGLTVFLSWVGTVFFGGCFAILVYRARQGRAPVVVLTSEGLIDARLMTASMPWDAVQRVGEWTMNRQRVIVVTPFPEYEPHLHLTRLARMSRKANTALGANGLAITASGTDTDTDTLMGAITAFAAAHATDPIPT